LPEIVKLIAPQGRIGAIDNPPVLDVMPLMGKSLSFHWEMMFARSLHQTADMQAQGDLLNEVSRLVDAGALRTTLTETYGTINAANLKRAHALIESNRAKGKIVLQGF
jgi:NADPH:quinone reductase-like Zn-dependent oxidoreductase